MRREATQRGESPYEPSSTSRAGEAGVRAGSPHELRARTTRKLGRRLAQAVHHAELFLAGEEATLAARGEMAARLRTKRVDRTLVVAPEVAARLVLAEGEHELAVA